VFFFAMIFPFYMSSNVPRFYEAWLQPWTLSTTDNHLNIVSTLHMYLLFFEEL
jgi:hypothetical protein